MFAVLNRPYGIILGVLLKPQNHRSHHKQFCAVTLPVNSEILTNIHSHIMTFAVMWYAQQCKWTIQEAAPVARVYIERSDAPLYVISSCYIFGLLR